MIYVMSDLHGCLSEFKKMLNKISFSDNDILYIIGDVIDRGPEPIKLLQFIMNSKNIHLIMGNHEEMMLNCLLSPSLSSEERNDMKYSRDLQMNRTLWILYNGGENTAKDYNKLSYREQKDIYDYLRLLKKVENIQLKEKKYILVHGSPGKCLEEKLKRKVLSSDILWNRIEGEDFYDDLVSGYEVIAGHTPTIEYGKEYAGKIIEINHKYLIDCGCVFGESLGCICLDNRAQYYVRSEQPSEI
ncbi:metallophosphoesterase [Lacrimispora amygdalina]|uniref:metallophosphoesterase n=1 Tax=Lacrimispora amygdalina TaxID=253257 RepID=UPI000BE417C7|nr:metallophosphoesterase [Lacrimispora amygdalina]